MDKLNVPWVQRTRITLVLAFAFTILPLTIGAQDQRETVALSCRYAPGDAAKVERINTTDFTRTASVGDLGGSVTHEKQRHQYRYLQKIVATWPSGRPQTVERIYETATVTRSSDGKPPTTEPTRLQGHTATITDRDGTATVTGPTDLDPDGTRCLNQALVEDIERYPLTGERRVGDTWKLPAEVSAVIVLGAKFDGTCRFEAIEEFDGMRCARLAIQGTTEGVDSSGAKVSARLHGTLYWSLSLKRPVQNTVDADMKIVFTTTQGANIMQVVREGTFHLQRKIRWTAIGGIKVSRT